MRFSPLATLWSLTVVGLLAGLTMGCGPSAAPTEQAQEATDTPVATLQPVETPPARPTPVAVALTPVPAVPATETASATKPAPTETATAVPTPTESKVGAEPEWERELRLAGIRPGIWETDFSKRSVPYNEIFSGGVPRDGIPSIDDPKFVSVEEAAQWLEDKEPVIALEIDGEARGVPAADIDLARNRQ